MNNTPYNNLHTSQHAPRFTLDDGEELDFSYNENRPILDAESPVPRQHVFNLEMGSYSDDDDLLDWEQYSGLRRHHCCGVECTALAQACPWIQNFPPSWWYRYSKKQRRSILAVSGCLISFLVLLLVLIAASASRDSFFMLGKRGQYCAWQEWRLPTAITPSNYHLSMHVQMEEPWLVQGSVAIDVVNSGQATHCIVLHSAENVQIKEVRLGATAEGELGRHHVVNESLEQIVLEYDSLIKPGKSSVYISFEYALQEGLDGFYRSTYTLDGSDKVYSLATTQFEANGARMAFPCFDEPALKAVFSIGIATTNTDMVVLSNMPVEEIHNHHEGEQSYHFQPTPPMSTYLVAFIIGNLQSVERIIPHPIPGQPDRKLSVWGTPLRIHNLDFAADTAAAILPAYESMFGIPYSLPKLDLVAIPDFSAGAMENWGCITYRETALLTSATSDVRNKRYVSVVVAHEMAHQYFGDLVTMEYWGELWLNEGFASYLEYVGANAAHPDMSFFDYFAVQEGPEAFEFASKEASHPLSTIGPGINSSDIIEGFFDPVSYNGGGSVLRMLRSWINRKNLERPTPLWETTPAQNHTEDLFLTALHEYLTKNQYSTATAAKLWASFTQVLGQDIESLMHTWTYKRGFPVVTATIDAQRRVWLQQAPFSLSKSGVCDPASITTTTASWWIPIAYTTSASPQQMQWFELRSCASQRSVLTLPEGGWLKLNAGQYGYYRSNYDDTLWKELIAAAMSSNKTDPNPTHTILPALDLAGLLDDSYALAQAGSLNITVFLDLMSSLRFRTYTEYSPWANALPYILDIYRIVPCADTWKTYLNTVLFPPFLRPVGPAGEALVAFSFLGNTTSVPTDSIGYKMLRPAILQAAGYFGDATIAQEASQLMMATTTTASTSIDPEARAVIYQIYAHSTTTKLQETAYHTIMRLYVEAVDADEKERALRALGYSRVAVPSALEFALSEQVKTQDTRSLITTAAARATETSALDTWTWIKANKERVYTKLGGGAEAIKRLSQLMESILSSFADIRMMEEVDEFSGWLSEMYTSTIDPSYASRAKESITANAAWVERHGLAVCDWVDAKLV